MKEMLKSSQQQDRRTVYVVIEVVQKRGREGGRELDYAVWWCMVSKRRTRIWKILL